MYYASTIDPLIAHFLCSALTSENKTRRQLPIQVSEYRSDKISTVTEVTDKDGLLHVTGGMYHLDHARTYGHILDDTPHDDRLPGCIRGRG